MVRDRFRADMGSGDNRFFIFIFPVSFLKSVDFVKRFALRIQEE